MKEAVQKQGMIGWQFNTVGVSDAITMGGDGMWSLHKKGLSELTTDRDAVLITDEGDHSRQQYVPCQLKQPI